MKKKSFLGGISAKIALLVLAVSGALLTGCYKDDGLDASNPGGGTTVLDDAVYTITGSITDINTGAAIPNPVVTCDGQSVGVVAGTYSVKIAKFTSATKDVTLTFKATGYNEDQTITRVVTLNKVEDGQAVVYPLPIAMKLNAVAPVGKYPVKYNLNFVVKDSKTGSPVAGITPIPSLLNPVDGGKSLTVTTAEVPNKYYESVTAVTLPEIFSETENLQKDMMIEILVTPMDADAPATFTSFSGVVVDKNGKPLVAETVTLYDKNAVKVGDALSGTSSFNFSISSKASIREYYVIATTDNAEQPSVQSATFNLNTNVNCMLVFDKLGGEAELKDVKYNLLVNVLDAETREVLTVAAVNVVTKDNVVVDRPFTNLAAGVYAVNVSLANYYSTQTIVVLEAAKDKDGSTINRAIEILMVKSPVVAETITLYGEVVDINGNLVNAQSIKLDGSSLPIIYNSGNFKFVVPAPTTANKTWSVTALIKRVSAEGVALKPAKYSGTFAYIKGETAITSSVLIPVPTQNGAIVEASPGDGEQGELDPEINESTGEVTETVTITMDGVGVEDESTITIEKGTIITIGENNAPLNAPIILTRNTTEEKDPSLVAEEASEVVLRSFFGNPDGAKFSTPLAITFADNYGGELGNLTLQYKTADGWGTSLTNQDNPNQNNNVALADGIYKMLVSHFSQFRAAIKGELGEPVKTTEYGDEYTKEINQQNNTDKNENLIITYSKAESGAIYNGLAESIGAKYSNMNAQKVVDSAIRNVFVKKGMAIGNEFAKADVDLAYSVAPYTLVKSITVKTEYETSTYNFTLNGKVVVVTVKSVVKHLITADTVYLGHGHGHGHGHGDDLNAGGGIIVGE